MQRILWIVIAACLAGAPSATAQDKSPDKGAPDDRRMKRPERPAKPPVTPPEDAFGNKLTCVFDRAWRCRHRGCLLDPTGPVTVSVDLKGNMACMMRDGACRRQMPFEVIQRTATRMVVVSKRRNMVIALVRTRALVTEIRGSSAFVVFGRCRKAAK